MSRLASGFITAIVITLKRFEIKADGVHHKGHKEIFTKNTKKTFVPFVLFVVRVLKGECNERCYAHCLVPI